MRLQRAVQKRPRDIRLRFLLGKQFTKEGKHQQAIRQFQTILRSKPAPTVMFQLGLTYARAGDLTNAVMNWMPILEQKPNNTKTMGYLGLALYKQGLSSPSDELRRRLFEESLDWWKRILKLDPSNKRARYFAGIEYFKLKRYEDAARQFLILIRINKNQPKVLALLVKALLKLGAVDKAQRTLRLLEEIQAQRPNPKIEAFLRKTSRQIERFRRQGGQVDAGDPDRDEADEDAVTRNPEEHVEYPDPPGDEPPPPPPLEPQPVAPPDFSEHEPVTLQAETLFLDGLEFKEQGNLEKALFAFLQAVDINPEFAQVYLQIGEVYLGLAKLAPTPDEFAERMRLAEDALNKVKKLAPGTLLAHAGQSKLVVVKRSQTLGFNGYHEQLAKKALHEQRFSEAFDEYVLLLSVQDFRPSNFFQLAGLLGNLTQTNRQDLRFFLEELSDQHPGSALTHYLLGRVYLSTREDEAAYKLAATEMKETWDGLARIKDIRDEFLIHLSTPRAAPVDSFVVAKTYAKLQENDQALEHLERFLEVATKDHLFYREGVQMKEQLTIALAPATHGGDDTDYFKEELALLKKTVRESHLFFKLNDEGFPQLSPGHLEDEARFRALKIFVENQPTHGLGRFLLGWVIRRRSDSRDEQATRPGYAQELIQNVHEEHLSTPDYHHQMALVCLGWSLVDDSMKVQAEKFFQTARSILLAQGMTKKGSLAHDCLREAKRWIVLGRHELAGALLAQARIYDPDNLETFAVAYQLGVQSGGLIQGLGVLPAWGLHALQNPWVRSVLLTDLGLWGLYLFLGLSLAWATLLLVRYQGPLGYTFQEIFRTRGLAFPVALFVPLAFLFFTPSGLLFFIPLLTWGMMRKGERVAVLISLAGLFLTPLLMPLSVGANYELLRVYELVDSGDLPAAQAALGPMLEAHPQSGTGRYLKGLTFLRLGKLEDAEATFRELKQQNTVSDGILVNLGVILAKRGDYEGAKKLFTDAMSKNPSNARALFNLGSVHGIMGKNEKKEQHRRWAAQVGGKDLPLAELQDIPERITRLPLLDQPLEFDQVRGYFSFFSGKNFFAFHGKTLTFLILFLLGGGLAAVLLILRDQLSVDHTQYAKDGIDQERARTKAQRQAQLLTFFLPGMGMTYSGHPLVGSLYFGTFLGGFLLWFFEGGTLSQHLYRHAFQGPLPGIWVLCLLASLTLHLLAQYLQWRARNQVEP